MIWRKLDQYLLRKIIGAHSKGLIIYTNIRQKWPRTDKENIYFSKKDPIKGDRVTLVKEDLKLVNIHLSDKEISETKKILI